MKLFFFHNSASGNHDSENWMLATALALQAKGHKVWMGGRSDSPFLNHAAEAGLPFFPLKTGPDFILPAIWKLASIFRKHEVEIVVTSFLYDVQVAGIARKFAGVPVLVAHNGLPILQNNWRFRSTYKRFADAIITNTQAIKSRYLAYGWMDDAFIRVIHNGIDTGQPIQFDAGEIRKRLGIQATIPILGIFGRLVKQKQHHIFLEVACNIKKEWPEAAFMIVGDGPEREAVLNYAYKLGLLDNLYLLGRQKNVMELYSICDVVLLTSEEEGLPNVVMEAMLAQKPVVAFDVGGVCELIRNDETGMLVPPNDIYLMTQRTQELLLSPEMRESIGRKAREYIIKNFSLDKMIDNIENYFTQLLKEKKEKSHAT